MRAARLLPAPVLAGLLLAVGAHPGLPPHPHDRVRLGGADVPHAGGEHPRMNLWLFRGKAPKNAKTVEVVVQSFAFTAG